MIGNRVVNDVDPADRNIAMVFQNYALYPHMTMADRIVVLNEDRIEQYGTPDEIYNRSASTFATSFIGAPPMNILKGRVNGSGAELVNGTVLPGATPTASGELLVGRRPENVIIGQGDLKFDIDIIE